MTITLPYPPSVNRYWRTVNGRMLVSAEARAYKKDAGWLAKASGMQPIDGDVAITIAAYRPQRRGDLDNVLKVLLDALISIAYEDDSQITEINAKRFDDKDNPRVEIDVVEA